MQKHAIGQLRKAVTHQNSRVRIALNNTLVRDNGQVAIISSEKPVVKLLLVYPRRKRALVYRYTILIN